MYLKLIIFNSWYHPKVKSQKEDMSKLKFACHLFLFRHGITQKT